MARAGIEPATSRFSVARSYQLSYPAEKMHKAIATQTGLEPATSAVTGRRANQLRYRALMNIKKYSCHISGSYVTFKAVVTCIACPQRDSNPCYRRERAMS